MTDKPKLDMDRIAQALGAERRGAVRATGGWFGAIQLAAEVQERFYTPSGGGRRTDPSWTERRLIPLAPDSLERLQQLSETLGAQGVKATPLQVAALLLEHALKQADDEAVADLAKERP